MKIPQILTLIRNQVHLFVHLVNAVKCLNLPFCRKEKPLTMFDYQRFTLNCFLFE